MKVALKFEQLTPTLRWPVAVIEKAISAPEGYELWEKVDYEAYTYYHLPAYQAWATQYENSLDNPIYANRLRVLDLVHPTFNLDNPSKIDFKRHLKTDITLQKKTIMLANGRPQKAIYYWQGVKIAEIIFEFQTDSMNLMIRRTERLGYFTNADEVLEHYVLFDKEYDFNDLQDLKEAITERSDARSSIFDEIRSVLNGVLAQTYLPQGKTYQEILNIGGAFWQLYSTDIDDWCNTGSGNLKTKILADTVSELLDLRIGPTAGHPTIRQYIVSRITY